MQAALITGAAGGIGTALCRAFRNARYRTVGVDIEHAGGDCDAFIQMDLERLCVDEPYRHEAKSQLVTEIGSSELRVLVNNAAVQILGGSAELTLAT